jgi:peptidoglycan/xylan/chitin deacetylase (PgdA/CDA1 family)
MASVINTKLFGRHSFWASPRRKQLAPRFFAWALFLFACLLLTSCAYESLRRDVTLRHDSGIKVPVIMYHRIVPDVFWEAVPETKRPEHFRKVGIGNGADSYLYLRSQSLFEREMAHLATNGYTTISLYQLREYIVSNNPATLPKKPVIITFDDGSSDWFDIVYPVLSKHKFKATFFVITNDDIRGKFPSGDTPLNWEKMNQMARHTDSAGQTLFDFESHTHNHVNLSDAALQLVSNPGQQDDSKGLRHELKLSMKIIGERIGKKPGFLALPYGAGGQSVSPHTEAFPIIKSVAQELGYFGIRSSRDDIPNDLTTDVYKIGSQIVVFSSTTLEEFVEKLARASVARP